MKTRLYNILYQSELELIRAHTAIRNCMIGELTVEELCELRTFLNDTTIRIFPSAEALLILLKRCPL